MNLKTLLFTKNECYQRGDTITPKGIMVHSTGVNNPNLKRYVGPDDGLLGVNSLGNHWNQYRPDGRQVCCHAFIGKLKDGSIATYQVLPWNRRGWHCGVGSKGSANSTHISFEMCEDGLADKNYLDKVYAEAVDLCVFLCKKYNLDPLKDGVIIGHYEGHKRGIASNHGDPANWFPKHGKSMDGFRKDVSIKMGVEEMADFKTYVMYGKVLKHGMSGIEVGEAQKTLKTWGYYTGPIDNSFGPGQGFLEAVKAFQKANELDPDGSIGPATQNKIKDLLNPPATDYRQLYEDEKKKKEAAEKKLADIKKIVG